MGWLDVLELICPGVGPLAGPAIGAFGGALAGSQQASRRTGPASNDPVDVALWEIDNLSVEIFDMLNQYEEESWDR